MKISQKEAIKIAAFKLFVQQGYSNTPTRQIAEGAGIIRGLLYYYYPKKEYILADMYDDYMRQFLTYWVYDCGRGINHPEFICLSNIVLFKIFFADLSMCDPEMVSSNILLTKITDTILRVFGEFTTLEDNKNKYNDYKDYINERLIANTAACGAASALLNAKSTGKNKMSYYGISLIVSRIYYYTLSVNSRFYSDGISNENIEDIIKNAKKEIEDFDFKDFEKYLTKNCEWFGASSSIISNKIRQPKNSRENVITKP